MESKNYDLNQLYRLCQVYWSFISEVYKENISLVICCFLRLSYEFFFSFSIFLFIIVQWCTICGCCSLKWWISKFPSMRSLFASYILMEVMDITVCESCSFHLVYRLCFGCFLTFLQLEFCFPSLNGIFCTESGSE